LFFSSKKSLNPLLILNFQKFSKGFDTEIFELDVGHRFGYFRKNRSIDPHEVLVGMRCQQPREPRQHHIRIAVDNQNPNLRHGRRPLHPKP